MAKIALLFSGLPRQWLPCVQSQATLFKTHEVHVFFHFWDTVSEEEKRQIVQAYKPRAYRFEPPRNLGLYDVIISRLDNINVPSRLMSQYASWKAVATLFSEYAASSGVQYDLAVRLRTDLMFFDSLDSLVPQLGPDKLLLSNHNDFGLANDMFAIGGVRPILYYHSLFDRAVAYHNEGVQFNPELLLIRHLKAKDQGIQILMCNLKMLVFRAHMAGLSIEECLAQHPGASKWKDQEIVASHANFHAMKRGQEGLQHVEQFKAAQLSQLPVKK